MKKMLALGLAALVLLAISGCQFNLFTEMDKIDIPSSAELDTKAENDPSGFLVDVNEYVDSDSISESDADAVIAALTDIYDDTVIKPADMTPDEWTSTQEEAAVLAGEIAISSDPETQDLVDNIVASMTTLSSATTAEEVLIAVFPPNLTLTEFTGILDSLNTASAAYTDFAASIDNDPADGVADPGAASWLDSSTAGDVAIYAAVSMIASEVSAIATADSLYDYIYGSADTISGYNTVDDNPLDTNALSAILDLAGIVY